MLTNAKQFFTWWTAELKTWFTTKFTPLAKESSLSSAKNEILISLTSINSKMDSSYATNSQAIEAIEDYLTPYTPINS